jgi:hypothetical protein
LTHARKPLPNPLLDDAKVGDAEKAEKERKGNDDDKEKEPEKDNQVKERSYEIKDWRRNGVVHEFLTQWFLC